MADQQTDSRPRVDLPVRIWGMSAEGRPFSQSACAQNISPDGALLAGVEIQLKVGDVIGLQCGDKKTRCSVTWVMNAGAVEKNQIGVKLVAAECPWQNYLPQDGTQLTFSTSNRRRYHRHKIALPLEVRDERSNAPLRINASDVSANGCYIESMQPLPLGTSLRVEFWLDSEHIKVTAMVRTCDPGVGNGIEFTGMPVPTKQRMQAYLDVIDPQMRVAAPNSK
jgi:hypothetical protein